jgi:hypothetical protein
LAGGDAVAELMAEVAELRELLARAEVEREAARAIATAEVKAAREAAAAEVAAKDQLLAEFKAMLAEARRPWWRRWVG